MASCRDIGVQTDQARTPVRTGDRVLGEQPPDLIGRHMARLSDLRPDLLLAKLVGGHGKGHQLLERHPILAICFEQTGRDRDKPEALAHGCDRNEEARGNVLLGEALFDQCAESPELVERMQADPHHVLRQRIFLGHA